MRIEVDSIHSHNLSNDVTSIFRKFDDDFIVQVLCKLCQNIIKIPSIENILVHHSNCCQEGNIELEHEIFQEEKELDLDIKKNLQQKNLRTTDLPKQSFIILQNEVKLILSKGKIKTTSQKKYQKSLEKFCCWLYCSTGRKDPTANDLEIYLQQNDLTICSLNALNRLKIIKSIPFNSEQKQLFKLQRITAQEKVQPKPHQTWSIDTIQEFINELSTNNYLILAYRIYMLFELATRMGEFKQITFAMIISGQISYNPEKQSSKKELARRNLIIREDIIATTKRFINQVNIIESSTLTLDIKKIKQKKEQCITNFQQIFHIQKKRKSTEVNNWMSYYKVFLSRFTHSKLTYLKDIGICKYQISEFVGHSDWRVAQKQLKKSSAIKMNLEAQIQQNKEIQRFLQLQIEQ